MALYFYQALSKDGKKITGHLDAATSAQVREYLAKLNYFPISIAVVAPDSAISWWRKLFVKKVTTKELVLFTKQLGILLKSGVPLLQALELLVDYFQGQLHTVLVSVKDDIKEGVSFAAALGKYPKIFNNIYVQLIKSGEASGKLDYILEHLTGFIEEQEKTKKAVSSAMRQPIIQLVMSFAVVCVLLYFVVPSMAQTFSSSGRELPTPTAILMSISGFFVSYFVWVIVVIALVVGAFIYFKSTPFGAYTLDKIKLKIPLVSYFARTQAVVQFSQTLGMLLQSGVNLAEALDIVVNIIDNRVLSKALSEARDKIIKEGKITQYLSRTGIFPPIAIYLINTGEQSGQLDTMLLTVASNYQEDAKELLDSLIAKLGPLMMIVVAAIVGFIVISIALPMADMVDISAI